MVKQDFKERFLKWGTIRGLIMIIYSPVVIYISLYHIQYILHALGTLVGVLSAAEGLYQVFHNPVKGAIKLETLKNAKMKAQAAHEKERH